MSYKITDKVGTDGSVTVADVHDIADAIRPWYEGAPVEVHAVVDELQAQLLRGEYTAAADYLGVEIEQID